VVIVGRQLFVVEILATDVLSVITKRKNSIY
jgi:hypothetical protein